MMRLSYFKGLYRIPFRWFSKIQESIIQEAFVPVVENSNKRILNPVSTMVCKQQNQLYQIDSTSIQYSKAFKDTRPLRAVDKYFELKKSYPDHYLLLYQIGEFYEFYGQDAIRASKLLDIVLGKKIFAVPLKRTKESHEEQVIEFTGFQLRNSEKYIEKLVKQGCYLVICDQVSIQIEDNEKLMPRKVTRIMTPGTITEDELISTPHNNHILSIYLPYDIKVSNINVGLAWMDISTGFFALTECKMDDLSSFLVRLSPKELVIDTLNPIYLDFLKEKIIFPSIEGIESTTHKRIPCSHLSEYEYRNTLLSSLFDTFYPNHSNSCIESFSTLECCAAVGLMLHIKDTQIDSRPILDIPIQMNKALSMNIDQTSFQALEIFKNSTSGQVQGSLLSVMDATKTAGGKRLLMQRLAHPSLDIEELQSRFDMVEFFVQNGNWMKELRKALEDLPDMERCLQRLALNRSTGGPNDLISVKKGLKAIYSIQDILTRIRDSAVNITNNTVINWIEMIHKNGIQELQLLEELDRVLLDKPSSRLSDGNIIKEEYLETYDDHSNIELERILNQVKNLEEEYRKQTDICSLKIVDLKHLGLLVNIPSTEEQKLRENQPFKYHSRLSNAIRYVTSELTSFTIERLRLEQERLELEIRIYHHLREKIVSTIPKLRILIKHLSHLDVCIGFAHIACIREYVRPIIVDSSNITFQITGGRHPVVEEMHALSTGRSFIKNDCCLNVSQRFWLITGPNMGGKSTFLRQNAIAVILAQTGSFVPANSMIFSLVDSIFTRIGSGDDLSKDKSTFFVEMKETATILRHATSQSLVIMDEVGRGTSVQEGIVLAFSICHYLYHVNQCRTLFATHYHELGIKLSEWPDCKQYMTSATVDENGCIYFHHLLEPGVAKESFGIEVAQSAGIPLEVIQMARKLQA